MPVIIVAALLIGCGEGDGPAPNPGGDDATPRAPWFTDATRDTGLLFTHQAGETGDYFMPGSIGSGAALFDFDNDGRLDLYLIQNADANRNARNQLFRQTTDGKFENVSAGSGVDVIGRGMGAAAGDVNNDGLPDLLLTEYGRARLFLNRGGGKFEDITAAAGIDNPHWGTSAAMLDYDGDDRLDIVIVNYVAYSPTRICGSQGGVRDFCGPGVFPGSLTKLYRNVTGDATGAAGAPGWHGQADSRQRSGLPVERGNGKLQIANCKLQIDGNPPSVSDIFNFAIVNLQFAISSSFDTTPVETLAAWDVSPRANVDAQPSPPARATPRQVRFEDVTVKSGLARADGPGLGVACADFTGDGRADIFIANDGRPNHLWVNRGDGTFIEEAMLRGVALNAMGKALADMGVAVADVDGDGLLDLFVTHLTDEYHTFYKQGPPGHFLDKTGAAGLGSTAWRGTGFGTVFADFDHDGAVDLAQVNGRVRLTDAGAPFAEPQGVPPTRTDADGPGAFWSRYAQRNQVFAGDGRGRFTDLSPRNDAFCATRRVGRGLAVGDIDNDGDLDLLVTSVNERARVYRNDAPKRGRWLTVRAIDPRLGGRDMIGAVVTLRIGEQKRIGLVNPGHSYLCSNDPRVHFGLGDAETIDAIDVTWPDGSRQRFKGGATDRFITLRRGEGEPLDD